MAKVYSIKCPNCSAPLELRGGKSVVTVTCRYCKSVIDLKNHYKILSQFKSKRIEPSPFKIGMSGEIKGVEWTIIGLILYSINKDVTSGNNIWIDYMIYSPIYGYAWLTYERGILIFTKKTHSIPEKDLSPFNNPKDVIKFDGMKFKFYECYRAYVSYVEGELNFIAKRGDIIQICEAINPPFALNKETALGEIEYSISEYLPQKEVYESFGVESLHTPPFTYPLKPFESKLLKSLSDISQKFLAITIFIIFFIAVTSGDRVVAKKSFYPTAGVIEFNITNPKHLVEIDIDSNIDNDWVDYEITIEDKNQTEIFSTESEISYYHGYEGGESWSEGSQSAEIFLKVPSKGKYKLILEAPKTKKIVTNISIKEGVIRTTYLWTLAIIYLIFIVLYYLLKYLYYNHIWEQVIEDEDDE